MNLYKLEVYNEFRHIGTYYVLTKNETEASQLILRKLKDWNYSMGWVETITLVASEGQYGKPVPLIFSLILMIFLTFCFCFGQVDYTKYKAHWKDIYPGWSEVEIDSMLKENWTRPYIYNSYTQYRERPYQGRFVNVDSAGFRQNKIKKYLPLKTNKTNIFVIGGSTTFGYGLPDWETIPAQMEEMLENCDVYNFGCGSYFSSIELILFQRMMINGYRPDIVIFIDGLNDFYYVEDRNPFEWIFNLLKSKRDKSAKYSDVDTNLKIVNRYLDNKSMIESIAKRYRIKVLFVWQPIPLYHVNPENHFIQIEESNFYYAKYGYDLIPRSLKNFLWLADMQQDIDRLCYCDQYHYNAFMSKLIAEKIVKFINW